MKNIINSIMKNLSMSVLCLVVSVVLLFVSVFLCLVNKHDDAAMIGAIASLLGIIGVFNYLK